MEKKKIFIFIGIFWLIIIIGFIASKEFTLRTGRQVLLKTVPIDPRDLFRGDYVILAYEINALDLNEISADYSDFKIGDKIYVTLDKKNDYAQVNKIYKNSPAKEELFLKGVVKDVYKKRLTVEYGIESYFVPEGKGKEIEQARGKSLDVRISIDRFGNAAIKSLLIDGERVSFK